MSLFEVSPGVEEDIPAFVEIFIQAVEPDLAIRFMFSERRQETIELQRSWALGLLPAIFKNPELRAKCVKATLKETGTIVGWALFRWNDGEYPELPPQPPVGDTHFRDYYRRQQDMNYRKIMKNEKHVVLGSLYVSPDQQRHGIGSNLIKFAFEQFQLDKEKVFVQTLMMSVGFYERYGWKQADSTDIDLSEWGGKDRGFGMHRSPQLVREKGPWQTQESEHEKTSDII